MTADGPARRADLEPLDWETLDRGRSVDPRDAGFVATLALLVAAAVYVEHVRPSDRPLPLVGFWDPLLVDWVFFGTLLVAACYGVVPLVRHRRAVRATWATLRADRIALASLAWLAGFLVVGTVAPVVVGTIPFGPLHQPPVGVAVLEGYVGTCAGPVVDGLCHGTLAHPLGTNGNGKDLLLLTLAGTRTALEMVLVTATIIVPVGVGVGVVAGYLGGRVDGLLMRYVDLQQTIPALFIYMALAVLVGPSLLLMIVVFGLLNWGNVARLVRSEVRQKRDLAYVTAARAAGVGRWRIIRRHVVPNVAGIVVTATALKLPTLVIVEATLSYLQLGDPRVVSWGNIVSVGAIWYQDPTLYWWVGAFPMGALVATAVAMSLVGNALQDALDPRSSGGSRR